MYSIYDMRLLQLFADGGSGGDGGASGAGDGAETAEATAVDAERQRLLELGVPADKLDKRARYSAKGHKEQSAPTSQPNETQDAAAKSPTDDAKDDDDAVESHDAEKPKRMTWDEIMADPEYNKEMQSVIQSRLKREKTSEETLSKLTPALEVLSRKYGLDPANLDYDALAKAVSDDSDYYENRALEMGVPVETAKRIDQQERDAARQKKAEQDALERQRIEQHIQKMQREGEALKQVFPSFDLRQELTNPVFVRLTSPGVGLSVEDAYYAVHRREIQSASMEVAAQKTAEKLSNAIRSGTGRPQENGTSGKAPSVTSFDYKNASRDQREALKRRIREAAARGEKLYPGQ